MFYYFSPVYNIIIYSRTSRAWDSLLAMKSGVREVVGSRPGRGNSKESFSSNQETGKVFSPECPSIPNSKNF